MKYINLFSIFVIPIILLTSCGSGEESHTDDVVKSVVTVNNSIVPDFSSKAARGVVTKQAANATGAFLQPFDDEIFSGNIFALIEVNDPDGLLSVALSFNENAKVKNLCEPVNGCSSNDFKKTVTNINPADYGVYVGPLTLGLWTLDKLGNQMLVDSLTLDWQLRRIQAANASRSIDGTAITVDWQNSDDILRYNIFLATEPGITLANYKALEGGDALLSVETGPQSFSGLSGDKIYYVIITGIDGSGESAYSSEFRLSPPTGVTNTPPQVNTELFSTLENQEVTANVLINDSDEQNDQLSVSPLPLKFPLNGELSLARDGSFVYSPAKDFYGTDQFTYEVQDGQGGITQGIANINIGFVNDLPIAADDAFTTLENQTLTITAPGILGNDNDQDGDTLEVNPIPLVDVTSGTLSLSTDGSFTYTPNLGFIGADSFTYQISDPLGLTDTANVYITVGQGNSPPIAVNDSYTINEDQTLVVSASASDGLLSNDSDLDGDQLQLETNLITSVSHGVITIDNQGAFTFVPDANFFGNDNFTYQINDGNGNVAQATATITINPVNDSPTALDDSYSVTSGNTLTIYAPGLLQNDSDPEQDSLNVLVNPVTPPQNGQLNLAPDGGFVYTADNGFTGQDSFTYQISDNRDGNATAQVVITVQGQRIYLRAYSTSTFGQLSLTGIGETSTGSGIGQVRYTLGDCRQTTNTECVLSGSYQEAIESDNVPNATGFYSMVFSYPGVGPSPAIAASTEPGGDSVTFTELGNSSFTLTLHPSTGGEFIGIFPSDGGAETNMGFSAFLSTNPSCIGLAVGQGCSVGQVGLTPNAVITGDVSSFVFVIPNP